MTDLAAFLLARITEDEAAAQDCARVYPGEWDLSDRGHTAYVRADEPAFRIVAELHQEQLPVGLLPWLGDGLAHVARWQPFRVLAECESKRRIVEIHQPGAAYVWGNGPACTECGDVVTVAWPCDTLRALAMPYADHPDYRAEWKP